MNINYLRIALLSVAIFALTGCKLYEFGKNNEGDNNTGEPTSPSAIGPLDKLFGTAPGGSEDFDDLLTYFNQLTPENQGKWGSVESTRDVMNWESLDFAYDFAKNNGLTFKFHNLIWGQQQPTWMDTLTPTEQLEEIDEWMGEVAARYPDLELIDVVNEPLHTPPSYKDALGGDGTTGYDWVITAFEMAREHFPDAKLILNDYQVLQLPEFTADYLELINLLKDRGLIDAIGVEAHFLEKTSPAMVQDNLDTLAATDLPIYITEFDLNIADDAQHANVMRDLFPVFWEHPAVAGVTHWGHLQGSVWQPNAYLIRSDGTERPALEWLVCYLTGETDCTVPEYIPTGRQGDASGLTLEAESYDEGYGLVALGDTVAYTNPGDWIAFSGVEFQAGWNKLQVTYAKGNDNGVTATITVHLGSLDNPPVATVDLPTTGSWSTFNTVEVDWPARTDTQDVFIRFNVDDEAVANLDSVRFFESVPDNNLITDGGFEGATLDTGWGGFGNSSVFTLVASPVQTGNQSLQVTGRTGTGGFAAYNLTGAVTAGNTYSVSAQVYQDGAAADTVRLSAKVGCVSGDNFNWLDNNTAVAPNTWTELSGNLVIPAACDITDVQIYFEGTAETTTVYLDEVKVLPPAASGDGNLVTDSGFEGATLDSGWEVWYAAGTQLQVSTAKAFAGTQSLFASSRVANSNPSYVLTSLVQPGTTYTVSAEALHTGGANDTFTMTAKLACDGQADAYIPLKNATNVAPDTWTSLSGSLAIPADCTVNEARIYFEGTTAGVDVYLDEVSVTPLSTGSNLLTDGGFESGITGWSSWNGSTLSASTAQVHEGSQSLLATNRPDANQFAVSPDIGGLLTAGTTYTVSGWAYQDGSAADTVRLSAKVGCAAGDSYPWIQNNTSVPAATWTQLSGSLDIPAGCDITEVLLFFEGTTAGVDVYVDEVSVTAP